MLCTRLNELYGVLGTDIANLVNPALAKRIAQDTARPDKSRSRRWQRRLNEFSSPSHGLRNQSLLDKVRLQRQVKPKSTSRKVSNLASTLWRHRQVNRVKTESCASPCGCVSKGHDVSSITKLRRCGKFDKPLRPAYIQPSFTSQVQRSVACGVSVTTNR